MNTSEQQIDFGLDHLVGMADDLKKGECDLSVYPSAMRSVVLKVLGGIAPYSGWARIMKLNDNTFALRWVESHPETLSRDEYIEHEYGERVSFFRLTKAQEAKLQRFFRHQEKMLPSRKRELLLSRKEALLLLTALYIPNEFLSDLEAALLHHG